MLAAIRFPQGPRMIAFVALSRAILLGFLRDKSSVFFAIIFPLMFLVLFGGVFSEIGRAHV